MSGFRGMVAADNRAVFLNICEFAEKRTVVYDGSTYENVPLILSGVKEKDRKQLVTDHIQGLYRVSAVLHCAREDLGGMQPEKGALIQISCQEGGTFFYEYTVAASVCEMGMLRIDLEAIDE